MGRSARLSAAEPSRPPRYLSDFGPLKDPVFPLWWDMLAIGVFSLAIYFWAMRVALPAERIEDVISRGAEPPDELDAIAAA
jgi:hypothetical protein